MSSSVGRFGRVCLWVVACWMLFLAVPVSAQGKFQGGAFKGVEMDPNKHYFLVATEDMSGPVFQQSVILLVFADETGALGLVINKPTPHTLGQAVPGLAEFKGADAKVYEGGPVEPIGLHVLLRSDTPPPNAAHLFADVYYSRSEDLMVELVRGGAQPSIARFFAGYSGWAPGQLEMELERGGWRLVEADVETLFDSDTDEIWHRLIPGPAPSSRWVLRDEIGPMPGFVLVD